MVPGLGTWVWSESDGADPGTHPLADVNAGPNGSDPSALTVLDDRLYFAANDGQHGRRLWRYDSETGAATLVSDLPQDPSNLLDVNGTLYFTAYDQAHGYELWQSDGTPEGTQLAADVLPGQQGASPGNLVNLDGDLYFSAWDPEHGREAWWLPATPGDTNGDRRIDLADFATVKTHFGGPGTRREGDLTGDGLVDLADFGLLKENFGTPGAVRAMLRDPAVETPATGSRSFDSAAARLALAIDAAFARDGEEADQ